MPHKYDEEEKEVISAALNAYADSMERRANENSYGFYKKDHDRVVRALLWEVENMRVLAKIIKGEKNEKC